jgi:CIC family chloride channel protein
MKKLRFWKTVFKGDGDTPSSQVKLALLSIIVGGLAGLGAVLFRDLVAVFHNLLFSAKFSFIYDASRHTSPNPWGIAVILVPVLGGLGVSFLVKRFGQEIRGSGVPEVVDSVYYNKGRIHPRIPITKTLASSLSIGSGASVGREGPILQIGSALGSWVAQVLRLPVWQRVSLLAAGAAGGIAATFNTPIGGILFAVEIIMPEFSVRTIIPVSISSVTAAYIGRIFFGDHPSFAISALNISNLHLTNPVVLLAYILLGLFLGGISAVYIRAVYGLEGFFQKRVGGGIYLQHSLGMFLLGIMMVLLFNNTGHYYVEGVGYATIQDILDGVFHQPALLLLLFALKLVATALSLGTGASGGVFSPALFMGATLGAAFALLAKQIFPGLPFDTPTFAVVGMAGLVGGSTGAALAAIVMIFEMTLDFNVILPMTLVVSLSYGLRRMLSKESIYSLKLLKRGRRMPESMQTSFFLSACTREVMDTSFVLLPVSAHLNDFLQLPEQEQNVRWILLGDNDEVQKVLAVKQAKKLLKQGCEEMAISDFADGAIIRVSGDAHLMDVLVEMETSQAVLALVMGGGEGSLSGEVRGVISETQTLEPIVDSRDLFSGF